MGLHGLAAKDWVLMFRHAIKCHCEHEQRCIWVERWLTEVNIIAGGKGSVGRPWACHQQHANYVALLVPFWGKAVWSMEWEIPSH